MLRSQGDIDTEVEQREYLEILQMSYDEQGYSALTKIYWLVLFVSGHTRHDLSYWYPLSYE